MSGFKEIIKPGAFANSLGEGRSIKAFWNHNTDFPIASTDSGTLKLLEDEQGLRFEMTPIETSIGKDVIESVRKGVCKAVSFGFKKIKDSWDFSDPHLAIRTLEEVKLYEISPVPAGQYNSTSISVRSLREEFEKPKELDYQMKNLEYKMERLAKRYK
jgi:HK97 family phage prohead protease